MGYNIEVSFNVFKNGSVTKLLEEVREFAGECFCEDFYEDYEFENKVRFQRRHCLISVSFPQEKINNMIKFLNRVRKNNGIYIELIYNEDNNSILYASQYFITQKMDKYAAKDFKIQKRNRSYSDDENMILNAVSN
jgi:predicted SAM-dependent methyltransferase